MKRSVCVVGIVALLLSGCSAPSLSEEDTANYTHGIFELTFEIKIVENSGQYKGRSALRGITCTVKLIGKQ